MNPQIIREHIVPSISVEFTDGEIKALHGTESDPVLVKFFGANDYDKGVFGTRIREVFDGEDQQLSQQADAFIRFCAHITVKDIVEKQIHLPPLPNVEIDSSRQQVHFDYQTVALARAPKFVVDYGPGLQGRFHVDRQYNTIPDTYQYAGLTKGPYINELLLGYWSKKVGQPLMSRIVGRYYIGRENGLADASGDLLSEITSATGKPEFADIVIASGVYSAGKAAMEVGVRNAYAMLREGGSLILRAPKINSRLDPEYAFAEDVMDMAASAGFKHENSHIFNVKTGGGWEAPVDALSAVLIKR